MKHIIRVLALLSAILIIVVGLNIFAPSIVPGILDLSDLLSNYIYRDTKGPGTAPYQGTIDHSSSGGQPEVDAINRNNSGIYNDNTELLSIKYFRSMLNDKERLVYDELYRAIDSGIDTLSLGDNNIDKDILIDVFELYRLDCPEHYWIENINIEYLKATGKITDVSFVYNSTLDSRPIYDKQIESIVEGIVNDCYALSQYEMVKYVHDYIVVNTSYDKASEHNQNIISVLINNSSVCAGYAKTTQYLLNKLGIQCLYVNGISKGEGHAWNIVNVEGNYYNLDTTWDDPIIDMSIDGVEPSKHISYRYFLITDEQLNKTHQRQAPPSIELPISASRTMNYFVKENLLFDRFDTNAANTIASKISEDIMRGRRPQFISFKFTTRQAYLSYINNVGANWNEIARIVNTRLGQDRIDAYRSSYFSAENDDNIVSMIILYGS